MIIQHLLLLPHIFIIPPPQQKAESLFKEHPPHWRREIFWTISFQSSLILLLKLKIMAWIKFSSSYKTALWVMDSLMINLLMLLLQLSLLLTMKLVKSLGLSLLSEERKEHASMFGRGLPESWLLLVAFDWVFKLLVLCWLKIALLDLIISIIIIIIYFSNNGIRFKDH